MRITSSTTKALAYMRRRNLSEKVVAKLAGHPARRFANEAAWRAHLEALEINKLKVHPDPVKVATEGALWGSILAHGHLRDAVIVSDDAGQFNLGIHALCWVHAERLIHKLDAFCDWKRAAKERIRAWLWRLYADLKAYKEAPTAARRRRLERRFDRLFTTETGFATLDRLLSRLFANKSELLRVPGAAGHSVAHQRLGERHPMPSYPEPDLRRHPIRPGTRRPRPIPQPDEDLRQTPCQLLGFPRRPPQRSRKSRRPMASGPRSVSLCPSVIARNLAAFTVKGLKSLRYLVDGVCHDGFPMTGLRPWKRDRPLPHLWRKQAKLFRCKCSFQFHDAAKTKPSAPRSSETS